jgi:hypothetical protein
MPTKPKPHPKRLRASAPDSALTGFGDHVPLRFAVRQIVPAGHPIAFGESVDKEAVVDWRGGKSWRTTLADMVKPLGLVVSVAGSTVTIAGPTPSR